MQREAMTATWKTRRKIVHKAAKVTLYKKDPEKSCADTAAQSRESYMKDPERSHADTAARSHKIYEKDLEKNR